MSPSWIRIIALTLAVVSGRVSAQEAAQPTPGDEAAALEFVREHHPELAELLAQLKPMKPAQYEKALRDLAQVSRTLGALKVRDPKRYQFGLDAWKARSRVEVLAARLSSAPGPSPELESQLQQAVVDQVDREVLRLRFEREMAEARLKRVKENLERAETRHDQMVQNRVKTILKNAEKARQKTAAATTQAGPQPKTPKDQGDGKP